MIPGQTPRFCCGPFAQKIRRLRELELMLEALHARVGTEPDAKASMALAQADREMYIIRNWIASHVCRRAHIADSASAS